jgi:Protein of unknown function (DUF1553)/Protein of unknown function (DUF1549)/Planctomycete cytochrome C
MQFASAPKSAPKKVCIPPIVLVIALASSFADAADLQANRAAELSLKPSVRTIFRAHCVKCHGPLKHEAELDLSTPRSITRGGEDGAVIVAGNPDDSLMWQKLAADEMPPEDPLSADDKALVRRWIQGGARGLPSAEEAASGGPDHWAFRPVVRPKPPEPSDGRRVRTDVDRFVIRALEARGLTLAEEADRATLLRRVCFDLTGLPPSVREIAEFLADPAADAYERMVDRYLASPRYGERWGQHWLDAAGYADSNGYFNADSDRPLAWRYRDYVIRAVNDDKPFDRFVQEQLAGDEMAGYAPDGDVTPEMVALLAATHFLRNAPDGTGESDGNPDEVRVDRFTVLEGNVQILASSMLGLTVQCARCHDHKFEPIRQTDYYGLQAILWPAYDPDRWLKPSERVATIGTRAARAEHARLNKEIDERIKGLREKLAESAKAYRERVVQGKLAAFEEPLRTQLKAALDKPAKRRSDAETALLKDHKLDAAAGDEKLAKQFPEFAESRKKIETEIGEAEKKRPAPLGKVAILTDAHRDVTPHHVLVRGDYRAFGPEVAPSAPQILCGPGHEFRVEPLAEGHWGSGRRTALARWITAPDNPLLARVTVNRVWQQHFRRGIVATADNFGYTGDDPSHPELLDYLASEFVRSGWSMKALHRLILRSAVYRQSSSTSAKARELDPDNILLAHFPLLRLDAESVRDAMLAVGGELDLRMGGPYVPTKRQPDGDVVVDERHDGAHRRSIYLQRARSQILSMLDVFDAPRIVTNCPRRARSTIPLQSLSLLNSDFVTLRSKALADRVEHEAVNAVHGDQAIESRIAYAYLRAVGRGPDAAERAAAAKFLAQQPMQYAGQPDARDRAWQDFCHMLLASNAFLYVE